METKGWMRSPEGEREGGKERHDTACDMQEKGDDKKRRTDKEQREG